MRFANRNIMQTAHADGTIRLYDVGHGDEIENEDVIQVDVARAVGRYEAVDITQMSVSGSTGELAVGLASGELVSLALLHCSTNKTDHIPLGPQSTLWPRCCSSRSARLWFRCYH